MKLTRKVTAPMNDRLGYRALAQRFAALAEAGGLDPLALRYSRVSASYERLADHEASGGRRLSSLNRPPKHSEEADLVKAEQDIRDGECRVTEQMDRVDRWRELSHDTGLAEEVLDLLQASLRQWRAHRDEIERVLGKAQRTWADRRTAPPFSSC